VHNDVKPSNIVLDHGATNQPSQLYLIDFGSCTRTRTEGDVAVEADATVDGDTAAEGDTTAEGATAAAGDDGGPPDPVARPVGPIGTVMYASVAAENNGRPTRAVDDIESLAYTLARLAGSCLPWQGQPDETALSMKREALVSIGGGARVTEAVQCEATAAAIDALWAEVRRCHGDGHEATAAASIDYEVCLAALGGSGMRTADDEDALSEFSLMADIRTIAPPEDAASNAGAKAAEDRG